LRDYIERRSESAFGELVRRHVDLVYSAALRMVRDSHLAEDITQNVFIAAASRARQLAEQSVLSAWLHRTTQNIAFNAIRSEVRRRTREQKAAIMNESTFCEPGALWNRIAPHLDTLVGKLNRTERDAILLRYFERKSTREMAQILGTSEDAAQKRVSRAVERLRELFARHGVTADALGLVLTLSAYAVQTAPAGLAAAVSTTVLAGTGSAAAATGIVIKAITMTTLQKTLVAATGVAFLATLLVVQFHSLANLRAENQSLQQRVDELSRLAGRAADSRGLANKRASAPPPPAPEAMDAAPDTGVPSPDAQPNRVMAWILRDGHKPPQLVADQLASYLEENGRSAASLLAAFRLTGNTALLEEATEKFPNDPRVAFVAAVSGNFSPDEQGQWLESFKQAAPGNALANFLLAREFFKSGLIEQALDELSAAAGKPQFQDYFTDFDQQDEEAFRAAGYSVAEAKVFAGYTLVRSHVAELKQLSRDIVSLAASCRQAGDELSAQAALQMALDLSGRFEGIPGQPYPGRKVCMDIETIALEGMEPDSLYGDSGQSVNDRLNELAEQRTAADELEAVADQFALRQQVSDHDWITYKDRWRALGEEAALQWLVGKYGTP
jgi:RNA polymerase sigma factor (sigma-70 family)